MKFILFPPPNLTAVMGAIDFLTWTKTKGYANVQAEQGGKFYELLIERMEEWLDQVLEANESSRVSFGVSVQLQSWKGEQMVFDSDVEDDYWEGESRANRNNHCYCQNLQRAVVWVHARMEEKKEELRLLEEMRARKKAEEAAAFLRYQEENSKYALAALEKDYMQQVMNQNKLLDATTKEHNKQMLKDAIQMKAEMYHQYNTTKNRETWHLNYNA